MRVRWTVVQSGRALVVDLFCSWNIRLDDGIFAVYGLFGISSGSLVLVNAQISAVGFASETSSNICTNRIGWAVVSAFVTFVDICAVLARASAASFA